MGFAHNAVVADGGKEVLFAARATVGVAFEPCALGVQEGICWPFFAGDGAPLKKTEGVFPLLPVGFGLASVAFHDKSMGEFVGNDIIKIALTVMLAQLLVQADEVVCAPLLAALAYGAVAFEVKSQLKRECRGFCEGGNIAVERGAGKGCIIHGESIAKSYVTISEKKEVFMQYDQRPYVKDEPLGSPKGPATAVYALYAVSFFVGITAIIGVIIAHVKKAEARGTWLYSHYAWQIRTFWWFVAWMVLGVILLVVVVGYVVIAGALVWFVYRIAKGWLRLLEGREVW